jgi:hypothetical protein
MIGRKKLNEIRATLRETHGPQGWELANSIEQRLLKLERQHTPKPLEIETLKLLRDGLRAKPKSISAVRKKLRTR